MLFERKTRPGERCSHPASITTTNFGLKRVVCTRCGLLEMRNLPLEVVVKAESLKAAVSGAGLSGPGFGGRDGK